MPRRPGPRSRRRARGRRITPSLSDPAGWLRSPQEGGRRPIEQHIFAKALAIGEGQRTPPLVLISVSDTMPCTASSSRTWPDELRRRPTCLANGSRSARLPHALGACRPRWRGSHFQFRTPFARRRARAHRPLHQRAGRQPRKGRGLAALADRRPGRLAWGQGTAGFATNRRVLKDGRWRGFGSVPDGPADRSLPILTATDPDGRLHAVVVGYACHCTTLTGNFNKICGDWAGYAQEILERDHPGAVALVVIGCGADADPQPRGDVAKTQEHGRTVAREVDRLLGTKLTPLSTSVVTKFRRIELPLETPPTREHFAKQALRKGAYNGFHGKVHTSNAWSAAKSCRPRSPYPILTWCFGDALAMVFLGGEVVVDYNLRLKRELDPKRLWINAYSNDVPCYIASKRVLQEGGYEADASMIYYGKPTRFAPAVEDRIIQTVHELLPKSFESHNR